MYKALLTVFALCTVPFMAQAVSLETSQHASSQSGGIAVANEARATGNANARAEVRTVMQGGATTTVRIEVETETDGEIERKVIERTFPTEAGGIGVRALASTTASSSVEKGKSEKARSVLMAVFERLSLKKGIATTTVATTTVERGNATSSLRAMNKPFTSFFSRVRSLFGF